MGLPPLPSWNRVGQFAPSHSEETTEFLQSRWARAGESQAPHKVKQRRTVGEDKAWRAMEKLLFGRRVAEQNRDAAAIVCTLHVGAGVANEPRCLAGLDATRL